MDILWRSVEIRYPQIIIPRSRKSENNEIINNKSEIINSEIIKSELHK